MRKSYLYILIILREYEVFQQKNNQIIINLHNVKVWSKISFRTN